MGKRGKLPKAKMSVDTAPCSKPSKESMEQERRWKAEDALRTLNRAGEIQSDKGLMSDVKSLATEQMNSLAKFAK